MASRTDHDHSTATCSQRTAHDQHHHTAGVDHGTIVHDPVCGMEVDRRNAAHKLQLGDATYYFCSARCLDKFRADPDSYLNPPATGQAAAPLAAEGMIWTCPMHPQIRRNGPGQCPICGMALEPA